VQTLSPTYRLMIGTSGRSNALAIAERLGMPQEVLDAARLYVSPQALEAEVMLDQIAHERAAAEDALARALKEAAEAATLKARARVALKEAEQKHREVWERATSAADEELAELRREAHRVRLQLAATRGGALEPARAAIDSALSMPGLTAPPAPSVPLPDVEPAQAAAVALGAEVMVPRLGLPGRVLAIRDDQVEVEVMGRRVHMPLRELEGATRPSAAERRLADDSPRVALATDRGDVSLQLDLRGLRRDEALERLETYLEDATLAGLATARIVHGKGTGAIRQAVRERLRSSQQVARFAAEPDAGGGDGATQVWFK
jgi:DNA mismatch repair protein MutS2